MKTLQPTRWMLAFLAVVALSACSKTVSWEEEVPLNTGEVIWVKRIVTYKLQGAAGNPLDIAYRPDWTEEIAFDWKGKKYRYTGRAGLMLLAISPITKKPVLVARADIKNWDRDNDYRCTNPFYAQLSPIGSGEDWLWPNKIESWLYDNPYNLMHNIPQIEDNNRYSSNQRLERDHVIRYQSPSLIRVEANYTFDQCKK